jgi:hypothetical protein
MSGALFGLGFLEKTATSAIRFLFSVLSRFA